MVTVQLISAIFFAYGISRFSHDVAQLEESHPVCQLIIIRNHKRLNFPGKSSNEAGKLSAIRYQEIPKLEEHVNA